MITSRREQLRYELIQDIKKIALQQLNEGGPQAITLRAIARELRISPSALYGYFDNIHDLVTALIVDSFNELATAVEKAMGLANFIDPNAKDKKINADKKSNINTDRKSNIDTSKSISLKSNISKSLFNGLVAYRKWAIDHQPQFRLIYFSPFPDYETPSDESVIKASMRVSAAFLSLLVIAWSNGEIPQPTNFHQKHSTSDDVPNVDTSKFEEEFGIYITKEQLLSSIEGWGEFHGLVALEVGGHFGHEWCDSSALYESSIRRMIMRYGFSDPLNG